MERVASRILDIPKTRHGAYSDGRPLRGNPGRTVPYNIAIAPEESIVAVVHTGTVTIDELEAVVVELEQRFRKAALAGMLVDTRAVDSGPEVSDYVVWARHRERKPWIARKMALLTGAGLADVMECVAEAAQNMGAAVWSFSDEDDAMQWLRRPLGRD